MMYENKVPTLGDIRRALELVKDEPDTDAGREAQALIDEHIPAFMSALTALTKQWEPEAREIDDALDTHPDVISEIEQDEISLNEILTMARHLKGLEQVIGYYSVKRRYTKRPPGKRKAKSTIEGLALTEGGKTNREAFDNLIERGIIKIEATTQSEYRREYDREFHKFKETLKKERRRSQKA